MKRTKTSPQHVTPGLFDSVDVYELADANTKLQAQVARLKKELAERTQWHENAAKERDRLWHVHVTDPKHPAARENAHLKREVEQLRQMLQTEIQDSRARPPARGLGKELLTTLLMLCHPDRWSQGQPATELAHELTVRINKMRREVQA